MYFRRNWCGAVQQVSWISAQCQTAKTGWIYYTKLCVRLLVHIRSTFRGFLKILYRNRQIKANINDFLEKIEPEDVVKDYLSVEELYCLAETPCKIPVLKTASLFSCLTSLRLSDIHTYSLLGRNCWFCSRRKMCTHHHTEDKDGRHHSH